jgi:hypothetical protein
MEIEKGKETPYNTRGASGREDLADERVREYGF